MSSLSLAPRARPLRTIETIQVLRFVAAGSVVLAHCASGHFLPGVAGVDLFFVISGFIISSMTPGRRSSDFLVDRFTRIYPIYWLALIPMLLTSRIDVAKLATSITLWPYFGKMSIPALGVGWTLCYEVMFYAAAALVRWRRWTLLLLIPAYVLCFVLGQQGMHPVLAYIGNPLVLEFGLGIGLAAVPATGYRTLGALAIIFGLVAIPFLARPEFGFIDPMFRFNVRPIVWGPPALAIVWGALQFEGMFKGSLWRLMVRGGDASYSLYLSHPIFLLFAPVNPYLKLALMPPILVAGGFLINRVVEKPLTKGVRRLFASRIRGAPVTASLGVTG